MPIGTNNQVCSSLKSAANMKLFSGTSVIRIIYEGLKHFQSFMHFNHDSIESISKSCSKNIDAIVADVPNGIASKNAVQAMNISTISIRCLVVATNSVKYYNAIRWMLDFENMHYANMIG